MAKNDKFCDNCFFYRVMNVNGLRCCHYLLWTSQKCPCDPGEGCTVKIPMKVMRKRRKKSNE